jgi:hypothetical protein
LLSDKKCAANDQNCQDPEPKHHLTVALPHHGCHALAHVP